MMKRTLILLLALMTLAAGALAAAPGEVRLTEGLWSASAYENRTWKSYATAREQTYSLTETADPETGLVTWEFAVRPDESGSADMYQTNWLFQKGIIAEKTIDFDNDGKKEWVVLIGCPDEAYPERTLLKLRVYKVADGQARLADEEYLPRSPVGMFTDRVVTEGSVNLRYELSLEGNIRATLGPDTVLPLSGAYVEDERGVIWYNVLYDGGDGWVSARFVSEK